MKTEQQSTNQTPVIRLVDDDRELLDSLSFMLEMEDWKVRCFSNAREFLTQDMHSEPGYVILDVRMPGMTGLQLQQEMLARDIRLPIIFLSAHGDIDMAVDVMQSGAVTFLQKPVKTERLLQAIAGAVEADRKNHGTPFDEEAAHEALKTLTERERQILGYLAKGLINRVIGERLSISERTVETHRASIYRKLHIKTASELMTFCKRMQI